MQKTKQTSTKLLVITITTVAIIAALTTVSISAATPAFAKVNCTQTPEGRTCSGGESFKARGEDIPGGTGSHATEGLPQDRGPLQADLAQMTVPLSAAEDYTEHVMNLVAVKL